MVALWDSAVGWVELRNPKSLSLLFFKGNHFKVQITRNCFYDLRAIV
ncbi:MAG: hypothetical protein RLZZ568_1799 [Cyanobacteriota bacterium]